MFANTRTPLTFTVDEEACRKLILQQLALKNALSSLKSTTQALAQSEAMTKAYEAIESSIRSVDDVHLSFLNPMFYNEINPPSAGNTASRVFGIPELLEMILLNLGIGDLLVAPQVCKVFRDGVYGSKKVQARMLPLQAGPYFKTFDSNLPGFSVPKTNLYPYWFSSPWSKGDTSHRINFSVSSHDIRFGSKAHKMLVCHPPAYYTESSTSCCNMKETFQVVKDRYGITVGDLLDAAARIKSDHRSCPFANWSDHNPDGSVRVTVRFAVTVTLSENDPLVKGVLDRRGKFGKPFPEEIPMIQRWEPFILAKQEAFANGNPIPTLAEFENWTEDEDGGEKEG